MDTSDFSIQNIAGARLADPGVMRLPLVSFVITGNAGKDFSSVIEAVRAQTYPRLEAILVNAGATDATRTNLDRQIDDDPRFQQVTSDIDPGPFGRAMLGLAVAKGDFVSFFDATELPLPGCAAAHSQAHLASRHNIAFTASSRSGDEMSGSREPCVSPAGDPTAPWLPPQTPVLRLACLDDDGFAELAARTSLAEPTVQGWMTSPEAMQMYRRFVIDLLHPDDSISTEPPSSPAAYYAPLCQLLGGSAAIDMALVKRLSGPSTGHGAEASTLAQDRHKLRVWAANGSDFTHRIGPQRYWDGLKTLLGLQPGSGEIPGAAEIAERMSGLLPLLAVAFGERQAIHGLDSLLSRPVVLAILRRQYGPRLPIRLHWALHFATLRQMHERARRHFRARKARRRQRQTRHG